MATQSFTLTSNATVVPPVTFTLASDAVIVPPVTFTLASDATINPAGTFVLTSDATIAGPEQSFSLTSDCVVVTQSMPLPDPGGDADEKPEPPPPPPPPMPCSNVSDCFPCFTLPTANATSELPDVITSFSINYGSTRSNYPPLGYLFAAAGCVSLCESTESQLDADLCAARQQAQCAIPPGNDPSNQPQPPLCLTPPCDPTPPTVTVPPAPLYLNGQGSFTVNCPDGLPFTFVVAAGRFAGSTQLQANQIAASFAAREARLHRICLSILRSHLCIGQKGSLTIIASGGFLSADSNFWELRSGNLPTGMSFLSAFAGPQLTIEGTATAAGVFAFSLRVTAPNGDFMEKNFTVTSSGITTTTLATGITNQAYSQTITADGLTDPVFSIVSGDLPAGLELDEETGEISGTVTGPPRGYTFTVDAEDSVGGCQKTFTLTVSGSFPNITPTILSNAPSNFADTVAPGMYRVGYVNGALKYNPAQDWALNNPFSTNGFRITYISGGVPTTVIFPGTNAEFPSQAAVEAANAAANIVVTHDGGGPISMYLEDTPNWGDNIGGSPTPTFSLVAL